MPPSDPREWAILQSVKTALLTIQGGSRFHYTVAAGSVWLEPNASFATWPLGELPLLVIERLDPTSWLYEMPNGLDLTLQVAISGIVAAPPDGWVTGEKTKALTKLAADIEVALTDDITRSGLVTDTRLQPNRFGIDIGAAEMALVIQPITLQFLRDYGVPNG